MIEGEQNADKNVDKNVGSVDGLNFDSIDFSLDFSRQFPPEDPRNNVNNRDYVVDVNNRGNGTEVDNDIEFSNGDEAMLGDDEESDGDDEKSYGGEYEQRSSDEDEDSEFNIDLENEVEDVEVDMRDFNACVDSSVEYVGNNYEGVGMNFGVEDEDMLAAENLSFESFDSRTDSSMSDFETRRSRKLREVRNKEKVSLLLLIF